MRGHRALGLVHHQDRLSGGLFTTQLLRETEVEIDPERIELLRRVMPSLSRRASELRRRRARKLLVWSTQAAMPWAIATSSRMETAAVILLRSTSIRTNPCHHARSG